jgi:hypothetical protein
VIDFADGRWYTYPIREKREQLVPIARIQNRTGKEKEEDI